MSYVEHGVIVHFGNQMDGDGRKSGRSFIDLLRPGSVWFDETAVMIAIKSFPTPVRFGANWQAGVLHIWAIPEEIYWGFKREERASVRGDELLLNIGINDRAGERIVEGARINGGPSVIIKVLIRS